MESYRRLAGWKRQLVRVVILMGFAGGLIPVFTAPAQADDEICGALSGNYASANVIGLCLLDQWDDPAFSSPVFHLKSQVMFQPGSTSATGCKITVYSELDKAGSNIWKSAKVTKDCTASLRSRNTWVTYTHGSSGTSATAINVHGCIDLYYGGSTSSGWQRCMTSGWHNVTFET